MQQNNDAMWSAGKKPRPSLEQPSYVVGMKAVDIFERVDRVEHTGGIDMRGEGQLNKDAVDRVVFIEFSNNLHQLILCYVGR